MSENQETKEEVKPLNLWQKIHAVMTDVEYLSKDGKISFKSTNYKAITEEKVTSTVRKSLVKYGLIILPYQQSHHKEGSLTTVDVLYKIIDKDTGEYEVVASSGTGADTQDKGVGKAMTYSFKYMLLRAFAIPTGEDPDKVSSAELDEQMKKEQPTDNGKPITQKQVGIVKTKVMRLAQMKEVKDAEVYKHLKVKDLTTLTEEQANKMIETLDKWTKQADKEGA